MKDENESAGNGQSHLIYDHAWWLSALGLLFGWSFRSEGMHHVPKTGPVLFVANHQSFFDPLMVGVAVRRRIGYMARKTLFRNPAFGWLLRHLYCVPVDQEGTGIEGLRVTVRLLQEGRPVLVFPEGERTRDGVMHPFQPGVLLLIKKTLAPIVPVGIAGAYDAWPRWRPWPIPAPLFLPASRRTVAASIGKPLDAKSLADLPRDEILRRLFEEIHRESRHAEHLRRKDEG